MRVGGCLLQCSSYSVGLAYERLVLKVLEKYGFQVLHTGGAGDGGQDFNGFWLLPEQRVPVLGQCKCLAKAVGPAGVREFEDVLYRKFPDVSIQSVSGYIGVMASKSWFTSSALRTVHSSRQPMLVCQVLSRGGEGCLSRVVFNREAQRIPRRRPASVWLA